MGLFSNNNGKTLEKKETNLQKVEGELSIISTQTRIKGEIETDFMLQIEGCVDGDILGQSIIHISDSGSVNGNITAKSIFIDGEVRGEIVADKVEIGEKGKVYATITSAIFVIQEGAIFEGSKRLKLALIQDEPRKISNTNKELIHNTKDSDTNEDE